MDPSMNPAMTSGMLSSLQHMQSMGSGNPDQRPLGVLPSFNYQAPLPLEANSLIQKLERVFPLASVGNLTQWGNPNGILARLLRALGLQPGMGFEEIQQAVIEHMEIQHAHVEDSGPIRPSDSPAMARFDAEGNSLG